MTTEGQEKTLCSFASSGGAKGSITFEAFLERLGLEKENALHWKVQPSDINLPNPKDVDIPFSVTTLDTPKTAASLAAWFHKATPNETTLSHRLSQTFFPQYDEDFHGVTPMMVYELPGQFYAYTTEELFKKEVRFPIVRLDRVARMHGHSAHPEMKKKLMYIAPPESDLRSRAGISWGVHTDAVSRLIIVYNNGRPFPCLTKSLRICANFATAELKKDDTEASRLTALHQWQLGAYTVLLSRLCIRRPGKGSVLDPEYDKFLKNVRHYGYIIFGLRVDIWEMRVQIEQNLGQRRETNIQENFFIFPCRRLKALDLHLSSDVNDFLTWHRAIMHWGFTEYAQCYISQVHDILDSPSTPAEYVQSYHEAVCASSVSDDDITWATMKLPDATLDQIYLERCENSASTSRVESAPEDVPVDTIGTLPDTGHLPQDHPSKLSALRIQQSIQHL